VSYHRRSPVVALRENKMNQNQQDLWKKIALLHILSALAKSDEIRKVLIFKGALILNHRLGTERMSLDIDSNLDFDFSLQFPERDDQKAFLEKHIPIAVIRHFESQDPVRYEYKSLKIEPTPRDDHPRGWDAFRVKINIIDNENVGVRGLPPLKVDVAAPETLSDRSTDEIPWNGASIRAYTLERIAGEKSRAFLSTLPTYRDKVEKPGEAIRTKDLYDLTRILEAFPITKNSFWQVAGDEFLLACESRFIDCSGIESFHEDWEDTKEAYNNDKIIPDDISFDAVEKTLAVIVSFWTKIGIIPFKFDLPT
jgi:hypothetical protein